MKVVRVSVPTPPPPAPVPAAISADVTLYFGCIGDPETAAEDASLMPVGFTAADNVCFTRVDTQVLDGDDEGASALDAVRALTRSPVVRVDLKERLPEGGRAWLWSMPSDYPCGSSRRRTAPHHATIVAELQHGTDFIEVHRYDSVRYGVVVARDEADALVRVRWTTDDLPGADGPALTYPCEEWAD
jgi:hypothetical protein